VNVNVVPDVVCVVVGGDDTMEYWVAYRAEFHTRSTLVVVGLEAVKPVTAGGGGRGRVLIELEVVGGPLPDTPDGVIVNVYDVSDARPVKVKVVPDVVCVVVGGDDTMEYSVAYSAGFHTRSTVVIVGLEAVNPVTAGGGGGRVLIELEVVGGPLPDTLDGVIVNVYAVSGVRPVNVKVVPDVVCVVVDGDDTMEYSVAFRAEFHTRLTVVAVGLEAVKPVTAGGGRGRVLIELEVVDGPLPDAPDGVIVNVYAVIDVRPVNVKVVPDVVCVVVGGEDSMEYSVAYSVEFHTRSTVVIVGLEAVKPVTAGGGGGRVLIELEVVGGPLADTLNGVIVNV
jgi:hypothetical protein